MTLTFNLIELSIECSNRVNCTIRVSQSCTDWFSQYNSVFYPIASQPLKVILLWLVHIHSKFQLILFSGLPGRDMESNFFKVINLDYARVTHGWRFCHNSITIILNAHSRSWVSGDNVKFVVSKHWLVAFNLASIILLWLEALVSSKRFSMNAWNIG